MKRKIVIIAAVLACLTATSCDNGFIERSPISNMNELEFYKTEADFNTALVAVYRTLHTIYDAQGPVSYFGEQMSDNGTLTAHTGTQGDYFDFRDHTVKVSNSLVLSYWNSFYQSMYRINTFLDKIQTADFERKTVYEGEARFIRGLYYYLMVQLWGDVPLVVKPLNVEESYEMGRTPAAQVYEQIISDLDFASKNLPTKTGVSEAGRISSEAAYGILAKVYLARNAGGDRQQAQDALMNIYGKPGFALIANYEDLWEISNKNTSEAVFEIQYKGGAGNPSSAYWRLFAPFENHGGYFQSGKYNDRELHAAGGGDNQVTDDLWNAYEPGDPRRDISIADGWRTSSGVVNPARFAIKWVDLDAPRVNEAELCDNNFIVLRYADVLLLLAEVTGDAKYLNEVRSRAGLPAWGDAAYPVAQYSTLERAIEHERQVELALEFHRYFDLKRTGRAAAVLSASSKGIASPQLVLPVPLTVITQNPNVIKQNDGF
jgi:hypothetical protein